MRKLFLFVISFIVLLDGAFGLTGTFWHLTDTHLLKKYLPGGAVGKNCLERDPSSTHNAGAYGDYDCDIPVVTFHSALDRVIREGGTAKPDFILYGGDHVSVQDPDSSIADTENAIANISQELKLLSSRVGNVKVYPMLGNHDTYPPYQFPSKGPWFAYNKAADEWRDFLSKASLETIKKGGYYTEMIAPGLRLIVVNTAMYFDGNWMFSQYTKDPGGQFKWLREVLKLAKASGEKVFIAAHIQPGASEFTRIMDMWTQLNDQFTEALDGYNGNTIVASFYGHRHTYSYRIITDTHNRANRHIGFVSASVTSRPDANPAFTVYSYLPKEPFTVMDRKLFFVDLKQANKQNKLTWQEAPSDTKVYKLTDLGTESITSLVERLATDKDLFQIYYDRLLAYSKLDKNVCTSKECIHSNCCVINYTRQDEMKACIDYF